MTIQYLKKGIAEKERSVENEKVKSIVEETLKNIELKGDEYIRELVKSNPELCNYDLLNNKGYGTKSHINAIKEYGKTKHHRNSFKMFS